MFADAIKKFRGCRCAPRSKMVIWITGLSGAGKTSIGRAVLNLWRQTDPAVVFVDGDEVRRLLGQDRPEDYATAGRRAVAERIVALCKWLDAQNMNAVCCTISSFPDLLRANRDAFTDYFEVYIDVPVATAEARSVSDLYGRARRGEVTDVVGVDIPYTPPEFPDMVINNRAESGEFSGIAENILRQALTR
jgi:adenylylsulfate kinase-like enzyme